MSLYTSMPELNPPKLSKSLLLFSTIEFIVGIVLSVIEFLTLFTIGAVLAVSTGSAGAFFLLFFVGLISGGIIFYASFLISVLLKARAAIVMNTYISALNAEKSTHNPSHSFHM